jgi:hypothetical protein
VTLRATPDHVAKGDWAEATCWRFTPAGAAVVVGMCVMILDHPWAYTASGAD